ncbi:hypothetical protein QAD02_007114 [Eretmocerus hayati]|uniref:Uncharacterized protein n=1 Tax=Eretmocerus hayati TaxID=131215 RepID=A0ACC2N339_9HYME|nr:hypothetical protein QAD02_007114 [Eretmocerus hayati]
MHNDFERLKIYLNDSYNANNFHIKDFIAMFGYLYNQSAFHEKFQSLPKLINEIWDVMGESGLAIRNSITWVIETIKEAFNRSSEFISMILKGNLMYQITSVLEGFVVKYDMFVREVHISFIKYIEQMYKKIHQQLSYQVSEYTICLGSRVSIGPWNQRE